MYGNFRSREFGIQLKLAEIENSGNLFLKKHQVLQTHMAKDFFNALSRPLKAHCRGTPQAPDPINRGQDVVVSGGFVEMWSGSLRVAKLEHGSIFI